MGRPEGVAVLVVFFVCLLFLGIVMIRVTAVNRQRWRDVGDPRRGHWRRSND